MDPIVPIPLSQPSSSLQPVNGALFIPGVFPSVQDGDDFLSSLDSDTRDYVMKHTDEFRSRADVMDCVNQLRGEG